MQTNELLSINQLMSQHPIRRSSVEKKSFRTDTAKLLEGYGYHVVIEEASRGGQKNIIIGDPEEASLVVTAHYDTPARHYIPVLYTPCNVIISWCYQALIIFCLFLVSLATAVGIMLLTKEPLLGQFAMFAAYVLLLYVLFAWKSNTSNENCNSSGVKTLLLFAALLPSDHRDKIAFILFDDGEKNRLGAKRYARDHQQVQYIHSVLNLDCVGRGNELFLATKKLGRQKTEYGVLKRALCKSSFFIVHEIERSRFHWGSDDTAFKCGIVITCCEQKKLIGYTVPGIRTLNDTIDVDKNVTALAEQLLTYANIAYTR